MQHGVTALEKTTRFPDAPRTAPNATFESLKPKSQYAAAYSSDRDHSI